MNLEKCFSIKIIHLLVLSLWTLLLSGGVMAIEEPKYTVIEKSVDVADIELRAYDAKIIAEVIVSGSMDDAGSAGFKLIAGYIFGGNTANTGGNQEISMTVPVTMEPEPVNISMTAPVTMQQSGLSELPEWRMHFVMPSEYTLESLPTPNNPAVTLREVPASNYAVIRFSGFTGETKVTKKTAALLTWLKSKDIVPTGKPELARYNPPWTLPFFRRNEVMVAY
jgi:hypothetical protein